MITKAGKIKQKKTAVPSWQNQEEARTIKKIKVLSYPSSDIGKTGYIENLDLPWINPPQVKEQADEMASALVHEMRNPLTAIYLSAEMCNESLENDSELRIHVDTIRRSAVRLNDLLLRFLTSQHANDITEARYSIAAMLEEVLHIAADRIRLKGITVIKDYYAADFTLTLHKSKLKIALTNIIVNAIEAMPPVNGIIKLAIQSDNGKYSLRIEDNGCGISKENLQSIFNRGFSNKPTGSGIGLSVTNNFLQANHVLMKVKSEEGKGTIFLLLFS